MNEQIAVEILSYVTNETRQFEQLNPVEILPYITSETELFKQLNQTTINFLAGQNHAPPIDSLENNRGNEKEPLDEVSISEGFEIILSQERLEEESERKESKIVQEKVSIKKKLYEYRRLTNGLKNFFKGFQSNLDDYLPQNDLQKDQPKIPKKCLESNENPCYINALLGCLYHIEKFKEYVLTIQKGNDLPLPLLSALADFFMAMKNDDSAKIKEVQENFIKKIEENNAELHMEGTVASLFRFILEELSFGQEEYFRDAPDFKMFAVEEFAKISTCDKCRKSQITHDLNKILQVKDINFSLIHQVNYFQPPTEIRKCSLCLSELQKFNCSYEVKRLPEILVIQIKDTIGSDRRVGILPDIFLEQKSFQYNGRLVRDMVQYEFLTGVLNVEKGEKGVYSVELSKRGGSYYYKFDEKDEEEVQLNEIRYHPKLLFYKKTS